MRSIAFVLGLAAACVAATAQAQGYSRSAQRVLAQARQAAGGAGWNILRGWHERGRENGLPYELWLDPVRYGMRLETREAAGLHVHGFNGLGDWHIQPNGGVTGVDVTKMVSEARTEAFYRVHGYFYPGRFDARGDYIGVRRDSGGAYDVVQVKPWGAQPRELWFDRRTHLLARMVDQNGRQPAAWRFSDYRKVGPVRVAFRMEAERLGPGPIPYAPVRQVESLDFKPADRAIFSLPRPGS